jgi:uncharacterized membrane protein
MRGGVPEVVPTPRILTLSDLIFGLALSISALTLIGHQPENADEFFASLGLYGFSFLILITVWRLYSSITSILPQSSPTLTGLNYVLLLLVSIEPYLFNELFAAPSFGDVVSNVYACDLGIMFLILAAFNHALASEERNLVPRAHLRRYRWSRNFCLIVAAVFFVSTVPPLGSTMTLWYTSGSVTYGLSIRSTLWISSLVIGWFRRVFEREPKP